jgi:hypothetical protein
MTFEEIDARAVELFSKENDASMWASIDEGDRAHWRKLAIEELEEQRRTSRDAAGFDGLPDRISFWLDADKYDAFSKKLDNSPPMGPALKALMKRQPLWES